jgi:hypothetical protein
MRGEGGLGLSGRMGGWWIVYMKVLYFGIGLDWIG